MTLGAERERAESLIQDGLCSLPSGADFALDRARLPRSCERARPFDWRARYGRTGDHAGPIGPASTERFALPVRQPQAGDPDEPGERLPCRRPVSGRHPPAYKQASMADLGYDGTRTAQALLHDWGLETILAGRPSEGEQIRIRRALDISRTSQGDDAAAAGLLNDYAGALRELGRLQEAAVYAERAFAKASERITSAHPCLVDVPACQGSIASSTTLRAPGKCLPTSSRCRNHSPAGHYGFASFASERALLAAAEANCPRRSSCATSQCR